MHRKRISKNSKNIIQGLIFFFSTAGIISSLIMYLWVYTEVDETTLAIEIQNATLKEFENQLFKLKNETELLSRVDIISKKAREEINMIVTEPEIFQIALQYGISKQ
tara:strand:- start:66 stop:386 length:321 start_codon:yes stop_codon:yes gene_type:complete